MHAHYRSKTSNSNRAGQPAKRNQMLIGLRPLQEAIQAGKEIEKILIQRGLQGDIIQQTKTLIQQFGIPFQYVPAEKLHSISSKNHQGIIAFVSPIHFGNLENIIAEVFESGKTPLFLMLDGVTDVRNFGAICRNAECMGAQAVIVPDKGSAQINEEAIKASAGALYNIPICRIKSIPNTIRMLRHSGITVVACSEKTRKEIYEINMLSPTCIIAGSEESGISSEALRDADEIVRIPMSGKTSSLNVSVATGIILYEVMRQHKKTSGNLSV
ncbi:MAG: 23S rRNA (guanosine(2251)-2'-O)-methyltransferase RlmB [Flavobacteriales bacterium]